MSNIEVGHINAVIDQAASRIVEAVIARLKDTCSSVELKQLDEHVDHLARQVFQLEGLYKKLSVPPPQTAECKCGARITALAETNDQDFVEIRKQVDTLDERVDKLTGQVQKLDNRFDNLQVLAADSAELTDMSIRLERLSSDIIELRGIKQDPASLVKRLEAVEEKEVYLERIIHNVRGILIAAATKVEQDL